MKRGRKGHDRKMCLLSWQDTLSATNLHELMCLLFFGLRFTSQRRVLLIIFDRMQTATNGIIPSRTMYVADRLTCLHIWCLARCTNHEAHPYGRYWHLAPGVSISVKHGERTRSIKAESLRRHARRRGALSPPLINLVSKQQIHRQLLWPAAMCSPAHIKLWLRGTSLSSYERAT